MQTLPSIHGHEVIRIIHEAPRPLRPQELTRLVQERFGPDARFHTCAASGLSLQQLLEFLMARGKVVQRDGGLATDMSRVCDD
jgi:probable metal-binding protein